MSKRILTGLSLITLAIFIITNFAACSKSDPSPAPPPAIDPCQGKTIVITATSTAAVPCSNNGSIDVTATGSANFLYKLNSAGTYLPSGAFSNVATGDYTVFAKDGAGCEKTATVTVASNGTVGPLFTAVKNLVASRCQPGCHSNTIANGGMNWQVECNIITNKARIKVRAIDEGTMPPTGSLSQSEKDIITNWLNAGGGYSN